jgi:hypothetical protein
VSESQLRDAMLAALERYLSKKRLINVTHVAVAGRRQPRRVNGFVPDVEGLTSIVGQPVYGVAESCDTYASESSGARLEALSRSPSDAIFLVVPHSCYERAKEYVEISLPGRNIEVLPYGKG